MNDNESQHAREKTEIAKFFKDSGSGSNDNRCGCHQLYVRISKKQTNVFFNTVVQLKN